MKLKMKKILKEAALIGVMLFVISNVISYLRSPVLESDKLPVIDVTLTDGKRFKSTDMKGKPLVVHFWATWCPSCKAEASNIELISTEYEVLSIAVNSGTDEVINGYMTQNGYTFRVLNDRQSKWAEKFKVDVFPTTFIYDAKGTLKFTEVGYTSLLGFKSRLGVLK